MNLSVYLAGLIIVVLLASACLAAILIYFDPSSSGLLVFILFYLSLFIGSASVFTLIGLLIRRISQKRKVPLSNNQFTYRLVVCFRQGLLLAIILVVALILQSQRVLFWWNLLSLVILVGLVEWWLGRK